MSAFCQVHEIELRTDGIVPPRTSTFSVQNPTSGQIIWNGSTLVFYDSINEEWKELGEAIFEKSGTLIRQKVGFDEDDFIIGRIELPEDDLIEDRFFFFDKSKGAFRGGQLDFSDSWSPDSIGSSSFAYGRNPRASAPNSVAFGEDVIASGSGAIAVGINSVATGSSGATALGRFTNASGVSGATALGNSTTASGDNGATALGLGTTASGDNGAIALGNSTTASGERGATALGLSSRASGDSGATALGFGTSAFGNSCISVGLFNEPIVSAGTEVTDQSPIFIVGNGENFSNLNNALVIRKNGLVEFDNYQFPISDGLPNQLLTTDGAGMLNWTTDDWLNNIDGIFHDIGNVGIGTTPSLSRLQVNHDSNSTNSTVELHESNATDFARLSFSNDSGSELWTIAGRARATGSQEIANLNFFYSDSTGNVLRLIGNGDAILSGSLNELSDIQLKKDITPLDPVLSDLTTLSGYSYKWKNKANTHTQIGLIAQEVQAVYPELVLEDEEGTLSVSYTKMVPILLEAIKEQQQQINELTKEISNIRSQINE